MKTTAWRAIDENIAGCDDVCGSVLEEGQSPSEAEITSAEADLSCVFCEDYIAFLKRYGGACIGSFVVYGLRPAPMMGEPWSVVEITKRYRDDGYGNPIGVAPDGRVLISDHDHRSVDELAEDFETFLLKKCLRLN